MGVRGVVNLAAEIVSDNNDIIIMVEPGWGPDGMTDGPDAE
jgi:hypothetical protein